MRRHRFSTPRAAATLAALTAALLIWIGAGCAGEPAPDGPRLLMFGVDAATWNVLTPMMRAGELPAMSALVERGSYGVLKSGVPVQSPQMWTSIATGVVPEKHGILRFTAEVPGTDREVPVTSNMRKVKAFWNILTDDGVSVGIVGWWPSWPAEEVDGFIIAQRAWPLNWSRHGVPFGAARDRTGRLIVEDFEGRTYPEHLYDEFEPFVVTEEDVTAEELSQLFTEGVHFSDPSRQFHARWVYAKDKTFAEAGLDFLDRYDPDVFAVYLQGTDVVAHYYWGYQESEGFEVSAADAQMYGSVVRNYYRYVDGVIARYLERFGSNAAVLIVSDHGFETKRDLKEAWERGEKVKTDGGKDVPWDHGVDGVFIMAGPGIRAGNRLEDISVVDVAPTLLAYLGSAVGEDMDGRPAPGLFEDAFLESNPIQYVTTHETGGPRGDDAPMESPMDDGIKEKLRSLGYIE